MSEVTEHDPDPSQTEADDAEMRRILFEAPPVTLTADEVTETLLRLVEVVNALVVMSPGQFPPHVRRWLEHGFTGAQSMKRLGREPDGSFFKRGD